MTSTLHSDAKSLLKLQDLKERVLKSMQDAYIPQIMARAVILPLVQ